MSTHDPLADLFAGLNKEMLSQQFKKIKADPKGHRNTKVFEAGKMHYRYYQQTIGKEIVRWCWTLYPNAAGYYLSFIEVISERNGARTKFIGHGTKRLAIEDCRLRYFDAKKVRAERRYTIPTYKKIWEKR